MVRGTYPTLAAPITQTEKSPKSKWQGAFFMVGQSLFLGNKDTEDFYDIASVGWLASIGWLEEKNPPS